MNRRAIDRALEHLLVADEPMTLVKEDDGEVGFRDYFEHVVSWFLGIDISAIETLPSDNCNAESTVLTFAFRVTSESPSLFRNILLPTLHETWHYRENGFSSIDAMERLHAPIVSLSEAKLGDKGGNVFDLGCGNGVLVGRICENGSSRVPFGVDFNQSAIVHATELLPRYAQNFRCSDIFNPEVWIPQRTYALTLLMPGRLLEVSLADARRLLQNVLHSSRVVLLYAYPDWQMSIAELSTKAGLTVCEHSTFLATLLGVRHGET